MKPLYSGASVLQLNGSGVDASPVEILLHIPGQSHVVADRLSALVWREHLQVTGGQDTPALNI